MANENLVMFKKGLQENLPSSGIVQNGFYLTTDTHRLYAGVDSTNVALLNSAVAFYANETALDNAGKQFKPAEGDIAFVSNVNALVLYKDGDWVQINEPDGNDNNWFKVTGITFTKNEEDDDPSKVTYDVVISQVDELGVAHNVSTTFTIDAADLDDTMKAEASDNDAIVKLENETDKGVKLVKGDNITLTVTEKEDAPDEIKIDAKDTTYTFGVNATVPAVELYNDEGAVKGSAAFVDDDNWITVERDNTGNIKTFHNSKDVSTPSATNGGKLVDESKFTAVTGLTLDGNHVTGIATTEFAIQDTTYTIDGEIVNHALELTLIDENGKEQTDTVDISSELIVNGTTYTIQPAGSIELPEYYTKEEVDSQHRAINAMVYKGVVNSDAELTTKAANAQIGWTFKVATKGTYAGVECGVGDLLIANVASGKTENENGVIASTDLVWDHIDTSDFEDTTYDLQAKESKIVLHDKVTGTDDSIEVQDDDIVILTATGDVLKGEHKAVTISTPTTTSDALSHAGTFTAITAFEDDEHGHITSFTTTTYTLPEEDTVEADAGNVKLTFKNGEGTVQGSIDLDVNNGDPIILKGASNDSKNLVAEIGHAKVTKNDADVAEVTLTEAASVRVIDSIDYDAYGHVSGVHAKTVKLDIDNPEYAISEPAIANNAVTYNLQRDGANVATPITIKSDNLTLAVANKQTSINLEWGSF